MKLHSPSRVGSLSSTNLGDLLLFLIPFKSSLSSCIHNYITSIHNILSQKWCTLYLSLFDPSNQGFHLQISRRRNLNRGISHTPFFDLRYHWQVSFDPDRSLMFQWKIRQRDFLKYLIFGFESGPFLFLFLIFISIFYFKLILILFLIFNKSIFLFILITSFKISPIVQICIVTFLIFLSYYYCLIKIQKNGHHPKNNTVRVFFLSPSQTNSQPY